MTWTYDPTALASSPLYQLRRIIGDTVEASPQFQDEELTFMLGTVTPVPPEAIDGAAVAALRYLANQYSRSADRAAGATKINYSQIAKAYTTQANALERNSRAPFQGAPYAGGISRTDKATERCNPDRVKPQFALDMDDNYLPLPQGNQSEDRR
jgi:hypothetical protein